MTTAMPGTEGPLRSAPVIAFVATTQPDESKRFYEAALSLRFVADEPFALIFDVFGATLRIAKVKNVTPADHTVLGWSVSDIVGAVHALAARGVVFERFDGVEQSADGVWKSPAGARIAWFRDPDGNLLSLTEFGP